MEVHENKASKLLQENKNNSSARSGAPILDVLVKRSLAYKELDQLTQIRSHIESLQRNWAKEEDIIIPYELREQFRRQNNFYQRVMETTLQLKTFQVGQRAQQER